METNKYYTPNLEEFCIGFEFEDSYGDGEYAENSIDQLNVKNVISSFLEKEVCIRVKYLDSEDIRSMGFIYGYRKDPDILDTDNHSCNSYQCILRDVDFCNSSRSIDLKMTYLGTENNPCVYRLEMYERNYFEWFPIFEGNIKNKSELKRLLKMIGAIE